MAFLIIVSSISLALMVYPCLQMARNYYQARRLNLPILITPFPFLNPFWALSQGYVTPILTFLSGQLPSPICHIFDFIQYSPIDWVFKSRYQSHALSFQYYAPAFLIVSPGETQLIISDPDVADDILSRVRRDFLKSRAMYGALELFGPNVDTVNGEDWARHRRITAPPFNERNSGMVWKESLRQATDMLRSWVRKGERGVTDTPNSTLALALHVLTGAGFGKMYDFESSGVQEISPGHSMSYRDALRVVLRNLYGTIFIVALGMQLPSFLIPKGMQEIKSAILEFKEYMAEMVEEERTTIKKRDGEKDNLMSALLRSSQAESGGKDRNALSDDEILGNLFIYSFAGHDTTANTLVYAIMMLAAERKLQDWIGEEINAVFAERENVHDWEYERAFTKLKRCLALQYEALRLYGPVAMLPKYTEGSSQPLTINSTTYVVPPRTYVIINVAALHTNPSYWGPDALEFRPDRFIISPGKVGEEEVLQPPSGNFIPWAAGQRVCPGKKFAQVEFVAVIAKLFMGHRVSPKLEKRETIAMASERVKKCVLDSGVEVVLKMKHPERVQLVWEKKA